MENKTALTQINSKNKNCVNAMDEIETISQQIGEEIDKHVKEYIGITGIRFEAATWTDIKQVLEKYGFKDNPKF